jgi:hypothetical protein
MTSLTTLRAPLALAALTTLACGGGPTGEPAMKRCFHLVEGDVRTTLALDDEGITVIERRGDQDLAPPERAPGRLTEQGFVYPDGTLLRIEGDRLTWPEKSLLPGAVFTKGDCPD